MEAGTSSSSHDGNHFTSTKTQPTGKVSVKLLSDEWLCRKMEKLDITVIEGYPSCSSETSGLARDQFIKTPKTLKWYDMYTETKEFSSPRYIVGPMS